MARTVLPPKIEPGDTMSASDMNAFFSTAETNSSAVGQSNLAREALALAHLNFGTKPVMTLAGDFNPTTATTGTVITSITPRILGDEGTYPFKETVSFTMVSGTVLNVGASVLHTTASRPDVTNDGYGFRFQVTITNTGTMYFGPKFCYSMSAQSSSLYDQDDNIEFQRHTMYASYIHTSTVPATITQIALLTDVQDSHWSGWYKVFDH
jgi:hypothetical protein